MRTYVATCGPRSAGRAEGYETTGILRYDENSTAMPTSRPWVVSLACADEAFTNLRPIVEWKVRDPANGDALGQEFQVILNKTGSEWPLGIFALGLPHSNNFVPFRIHYDEPTILQLGNAEDIAESYLVVPEDHGDNDWARLCPHLRPSRVEAA